MSGTFYKKMSLHQDGLLETNQSKLSVLLSQIFAPCFSLDHPFGSQTIIESFLLFTFTQFCHACLLVCALPLVFACIVAFLSPFWWCHWHFLFTLSIAFVPIVSDQTSHLFCVFLFIALSFLSPHQSSWKSSSLLFPARNMVKTPKGSTAPFSPQCSTQLWNDEAV